MGCDNSQVARHDSRCCGRSGKPYVHIVAPRPRPPKSFPWKRSRKHALPPPPPPPPPRAHMRGNDFSWHVQVNGCFDDGMAYVSLSRVRTLDGLRFQRNCPVSLECPGCSKCICRLTPADIRASAEVCQRAAQARVRDSLASLAGTV